MRKKKILPPTYFLISILLIVIFHFTLPLYQLIFFPFNLIGLLPLLFGIVLNLKADGDFKNLGTTVKPFEKSSVLVTGGVFGLSRHPMYLGMTSILLGTSLLLGSIIPFVVVAIFAFLMEKNFIKTEEKMLHDAFGEEYLKYKKKVRKWI